MNEIQIKIKKRKAFLLKLLSKINLKASCLPDGTIIIARRKGHTQYYYKDKGNCVDRTKKYIKKENLKLIHDLMQKNYIERLRRSIAAELEAIDSYLEAMPNVLAEDIYDNLNEERRAIVDPEVETDDIFRHNWENAPFVALNKPFNSDSLKTDRGEVVRSKSEYIIANILYKHSIPYKYEKALKLNHEVVYPDFTILDIRNRRELYLEHLGMLSDPVYLTRAIRKVNEYNRSGFCLGSRLLVTMESSEDTIDIKATEIMILNALGSTP